MTTHCEEGIIDLSLQMSELVSHLPKSHSW